VTQFSDGELYERSIETSTGRVDVLAEIWVRGTTIELRDIAVYPHGAERLRVEPAELLAAAHRLLQELGEAGFDYVHIAGTRLSGRRRDRRVNLVIHVRKGAL
jgi:hypothetical protein